MRLLVVACLVASAAPARAQAPGEVAPVPPPIMERWAIGLSLASESLRPSDNGGEVGFGVLEAAVRYRATWRLELAGSLAAGGDKTNIKLGALFLDARYRFVPDQQWKWDGLARVGITRVAARPATQNEKPRPT